MKVEIYSRGHERLVIPRYAALPSLFHTCFPSMFSFSSGPRHQQILWFRFHYIIFTTQTENTTGNSQSATFSLLGTHHYFELRLTLQEITHLHVKVRRLTPQSVSTISKGYHRILYNSSTIQVNSCFTIHTLIKSFASIIIKSSHCAEIGLQSIEGIGILPPSSSYPVIHRISSSARFRARSRS